MNKFLKSPWLKALVACTLLVIAASSKAGTSSPHRKVGTIVIDAGHGGEDIGAPGSYSREKDVALKIALALGKAIQEAMPGVKVVYTRTTDVKIKLYDRIGLANRLKADLFISIHCNSMPLKTPNRSSVKGTETILSGSGRLGEQDVAIRENASILLESDYKENYEDFVEEDPAVRAIAMSLMKNAYRKQSLNLAMCLQEQFKQNGRLDKGVREQSLAVLARAGMPAVLTEIGYISSREEEDYMNSELGQKEIVTCLLNGILSYKNQSDQYLID